MNHLKVISLCALLSLTFGAGCSSSSGTKADGGGSGGHTGTGGSGTGGSTGTGGAGTDGGGTGGTPDGAAGSDGAMGIDGGDGPAEGPIEFTDFVNDLIKNKTAANNRPETIDDKVFKDSMNPAAFDSLFP